MLSRVLGLAVAVSVCIPVVARQPPDGWKRTLREALTFHAPFDRRPDAAFGLGDRALYSAPSRKEAASATAGMPPGVEIASGRGRHGDALRITLGSSPFLFFKGERNMPYRPQDWSGTVSVWFNLHPDRDLAPGYSDPLIITPRSWDDASMFVDFTRDDVPRRFRFAAFADRAVWDPQKRRWEDVPVAERPMVNVAAAAFRGGWTHVAWTYSKFNTGGADGVVACYINGEPAGTLTGRRQIYTWEPRDVLIGLGVQFNGLVDDLSIFNRALTADEMRRLYELDGGVGAVRPAVP